ncbi:MAG TPA: hypothetical protein DCG79_05365 [Clostridiales bacterium]|nr:hypothetical protein [Clostridiales bacterium]
MAKIKQKINDHSWLFDKPIAHRGLHGGGVVENSLAAFEAAIQKGYNIEIDVHILADDSLVVYHDNTLERIFGENVELQDLTYEQLCHYTLPFVNEHIPTFEEVLNYVNGRTGLLIEIKTYIRTRVAERMAEALENYQGNYAIQSFSPTALSWYRKHVPSVPIGILASDVVSFALYWSNHIHPDFISYQVSNLNDRRAIILRGKAPKVLAWTVANPILEKKARTYAENIIFEGYEADPNAKSVITIRKTRVI